MSTFCFVIAVVKWVTKDHLDGYIQRCVLNTQRPAVQARNIFFVHD